MRTRSFTARASGNSGGDLFPMAPLQLESAIGQLLGQIMQTHPHLFLATAEQQLENLQSQRDVQNETNAPSPQDLLLYKYVFSFEIPLCEVSVLVEQVFYYLFGRLSRHEIMSEVSYRVLTKAEASLLG